MTHTNIPCKRLCLLTALRSQRGVALLVVCYVFAAFLLTVGSTFLTISMSEQRIAQRYVDLSRAFYSAESGLDAAIVQLRTTGNAAAIGQTTLSQSPATTYHVTMSALGGGLYSVQATGQNSASQVSTVVTSYVQVAPSSTQRFFGRQSLSVAGSAIVDSIIPPQGSSSILQSGGDVSSDGRVSLAGSAVINGDVTGSPIQEAGSVVVTGQRRAATTAHTITTDPEPPGCRDMGALQTAGTTTITLNGPCFRYTSIQTAGRTTIETVGAVKVYVTGSVRLAGTTRLTGAGNDSQNLKIYVTGGSDVQVAGSTSFTGELTAPNTSVLLAGSTTFIGRLQANSISVAGSAVLHLDRRPVAGASSNFDVTSKAWQVQ